MQMNDVSRTRIFTRPDEVPDVLRGGVIAIGNFDGVHRGHQAVIRRAVSEAKARRAPALAMTFEPHPRTYFKPDTPVFRLTPLALKARILTFLGLDAVIALPFDAALAALAAEDFVKSILCDGLRAQMAIAGFDFHFGRGRAGTPQFLEEAGQRHGFATAHVDAFSDKAGRVVSSTLIREALGAGDLDLANGDLGWRWAVEGEVIHGDKRGRNLGFPTANMNLPANCVLRQGVYAVRVLIDGAWYAGAANYGRRIQFGDGPAILETHVMDFSGDLYDRSIRVEFCRFLRDEARFASVDALVAQMGHDVGDARHAVSATLGAPRTDLQASLEDDAAD